MKLPGPQDLARLAGDGYRALETAIGLVPRLVALLAEVQAIMVRVGIVVTEVEQTQRRAAVLVTHIDELQGRVQPLLDGFQPALDRLLPVITRLAETTSPDEVSAIIKLIDALPPIVDKLDADILPVLDTLATVAPDLRDLLDVSRELNQIIGSVPGLGRIKRKVEEQQADSDEVPTYRAEEEPAAAPERRTAANDTADQA